MKLEVPLGICSSEDPPWPPDANNYLIMSHKLITENDEYGRRRLVIVDINLVLRVTQYSKWAPTTEHFGGFVALASTLEFVDSDHDLIFADDASTLDWVREIGTKCGVDFDKDASVLVIDHSSYAVSDIVTVVLILPLRSLRGSMLRCIWHGTFYCEGSFILSCLQCWLLCIEKG